MSESTYSLKDFRSPHNPEEDIKIDACINKIMGTLSFRKLAGKTQVILSINGPDIRTRLTHTMEVARIARDLCRDLDLNADLAEAIALAHDIGHTPFGHVGERTLTEIMCGCNTLDGKVSGEDFENAGFKHNLQSFRVLNNLEEIVDVEGDYKKIWPYILWGALTHTKMTYSKRSAGKLEDDIFISGFHCKHIYNCYFSKNHECHRNQSMSYYKKNKEHEDNDGKVCKPWYCATLEEDDDKKDIKCSNNKCYLSKLWKSKIDRNDIFSDLQFLFDHPFPNIFYSRYINEYFFDGEKNEEWISLEACIVKQADEIAQRQQDMEDAVNKDLMTIDDAIKEVKKMLEPFKKEEEIKILLRDKKLNSHDLGEIISTFYKEILKKFTFEKINKFTTETNQIKENVYILMDYIYRFYIADEEKRREWILKELEQLSDPNTKDEECQKNDYFDWNDSEYEEDRHALFEIAFDFLDTETKRRGGVIVKSNGNDGKPNKYSDMLNQILKCIKKNGRDFKPNCHTGLSEEIKFFNSLREVGIFVKKKRGLPTEKPKIKLQLFHYYVLNEFYDQLIIKKQQKEIPLISDMIEFLMNLSDRKNIESMYGEKRDEFFHKWKRKLKIEAHKILENLIDFTDRYKKDDKLKALEEFEESQNITIINSEIVEKNDGKASYILRRLFRAYITNPHQLPDLALKFLLRGIQDTYNNTNKTTFDDDIIKTLDEKLNELKPTLFMVEDNKREEKIKDIINSILFHKESEQKDENGLSNEVKALYEEAKKLKKFLIEYYENGCLKTDGINIKERGRKFRGILDNALLRAIPTWKSILTRSICDHIAGMTDQEAIIEYEKLYTGMMELV